MLYLRLLTIYFYIVESFVLQIIYGSLQKQRATRALGEQKLQLENLKLKGFGEVDRKSLNSKVHTVLQIIIG